MPRSSLLLALTVAAPLAAQDSLKATIDVGFVNTAGNTDVTSLNVGEGLVLMANAWTLTQRFAVVYARTAGVTQTLQWKAGARADHPLAAPLGAFALVAYERNTFAGIDRRLEETVGFTASLLAQDGNTLLTEVGVSANQETPVAGSTATFAAGRLALMYRRDLTETAYATLDSEFLPNLKTTDDYRVNGQASLVAPISSRIATKLSYVVQYDHLPEAGFQTTDRIFTAGLQVTF